jgi:Pyridoxamine 5'-phosphate oxidase
MNEFISDAHAEFIARQKMFFTATAPLSSDGHVNVSPKGLDCFRILSPTRVAYLDVVGSGNETSAHLLENGRITLMFCSFDETPAILRLYGRGTTVLPSSPEWSELIQHFDIPEYVRQLIVIEVLGVKKSCGFGVPRFEFSGTRGLFDEWSTRKGPDGLLDYQREKNRKSLDDLPTALDEWFNRID